MVPSSNVSNNVTPAALYNVAAVKVFSKVTILRPAPPTWVACVPVAVKVQSITHLTCNVAVDNVVSSAVVKRGGITIYNNFGPSLSKIELSMPEKTVLF